MRIQQRVEAFREAFPGNSASWPWVTNEKGGEVLYALWLIGNDYRNRSKFYGSYPPGYLARVDALFPDVTDPEKLHVFSGSLPEGDYERCDSVQPSEMQMSVYDLPAAIEVDAPWRPQLIIADPPYSKADAKKYSTPMINRGRVFRTLAEITAPGAHVVWLDQVWPMFRKDQWRTVGRITVVRSTNHRVRMASIFERV